MRQGRKLKQYSTREINGIMESLRERYDIVRLVDVEECRILEVQSDGAIHHGCNCFDIWNRKKRCANCSSYRACMTNAETDKSERLGTAREDIHSIPIYLEHLSGEIEMCVIECVRGAGEDTRALKPEEDSYTATHDVLTRLYTQEKLLREMRQKLMDRPDDRWLMVMANIRNFHLINRLFGIECGNRILMGIADILREVCGGEEVYGRYRDDRFVLLIRRDRFDEAAFCAEMARVKALLESPIYAIQMKLGVYEIVDHQLPVMNMIDHAEEAASAIRDARGQMVGRYDPGMMTRRLRDQQIVSGFQQALDGGEFTIYLQPQVRDDGMVRGAEALVRWEKPDGDLLLPGEFIDVLQQSELLSHLDAYVWDRAAQVLARWKGTALEDLYISVNADPMDFYYMDVPGKLTDICQRRGVSPSRLRVEITETAFFEDVELRNDTLNRLRREGFVVEIDDFGKGYSSLSLLKDIQADVLKIDMGFLQSTENSHRSRVILQSVIEMAGALKMGVITEGVETQEQAERLAALGCHNFQGYYFSRPVPVPDFELLARENVETPFRHRRG